MREYGRQDYWEKRYRGEKKTHTFDWIMPYDIFAPSIADLAPKSGKILNLGCGNSNTMQDMFKDGYVDQVAIDYSPEVVQRMQAKLKDCEGISVIQMDAREMEFPNDTFDLAIDKATLDGIFCSDDDNNVIRVIDEVWRVLKPGGVWDIISYKPTRGEDILQTYPSLLEKWDMKKVIVDNPFVDYNGSVTEEGPCTHCVLLTKKAALVS